jgi:hypothetical protein
MLGQRLYSEFVKIVLVVINTWHRGSNPAQGFIQRKWKRNLFKRTRTYLQARNACHVIGQSGAVNIPSNHCGKIDQGYSDSNDPLFHTKMSPKPPIGCKRSKKRALKIPNEPVGPVKI